MALPSTVRKVHQYTIAVISQVEETPVLQKWGTKRET
jgi:hypothetical protein